MGRTLKDSFRFNRYSTYRQEEGRECFYTLCPLFLTSTDLIKDNKREAERLPYNHFLLYDRRGGVSPPAL